MLCNKLGTFEKTARNEDVQAKVDNVKKERNFVMVWPYTKKPRGSHGEAYLNHARRKIRYLPQVNGKYSGRM